MFGNAVLIELTPKGSVRVEAEQEIIRQRQHVLIELTPKGSVRVCMFRFIINESTNKS